MIKLENEILAESRGNNRQAKESGEIIWPFGNQNGKEQTRG